MEIIHLTPAHPLWNVTIDFAENCSWVAGKHLAGMMRENRFVGWETMFAAVEDGVPVGYCTFLKEDYYPENRYFPWISSIFVTEALRRRRICGQLIAAACEYARSVGFLRVYIPTDITGLYEKYGFEMIDTLTNYAGDVDMIFTKVLRE